MLSNFRDAWIHQLFEFQVEHLPDEIAVIYEGKQLTYQELNSQANQLAHHLRSLGVGPEVLVAACVERSLESVVGLLGILKAGGAYVPLDPNYPPSRLAFMLEHSQAPVLLTQQHLVESLPEHQAHVICLDANPETLLGKGTGVSFTDENPDSGVTPDNLAYVIYTSGSTGQPKGVAIEHRGAVNTLLDINQRFEVGVGDRVLAVSSLSFDLSVYDIFGLLAVGGTVVIPKASATPDPADWLDVMTRERVTLWDSAPPLMQMLADYATAGDKTLPSSLRLVLLSGDWIPLNLPDRIKDLVSKSGSEINLTSPPAPLLQGEGSNLTPPFPCREGGSGGLGLSSTPAVISLGGATEASIWSILYPIAKVEPDWKSIPYGRAMTNQQFYVLNEAMEECQEGEAGQLYIGGIGLARCYWRDPEKTSQRFITHPHTGTRLYCTGDLGRYLPDGNIEFIGRIDNQVKIRGFRIELGEIEAVLNQHPDVQVAVVTAPEEIAGQKRLVAFVVSKLTAERIPCKTEVITEFDDNSSVKVQTEDISIGGIGLVNVPNHWFKDQSINLRLILPGNIQESSFQGTVAWCNGNRAGIELSLTSTEQTVIQQSIDYLLESQGFLKFLQRTAAGKLRSFLKDKLPDYMVPSSFVFLNSLPLTPNGKIDRQNLVADAVKNSHTQSDLSTSTVAISGLDSNFVAPRTPTEEVLAGIWAEVLGLEHISIQDKFLELGGHSLLVTKIVTRIRETFQIEIPLRTVFESSTVAELAHKIEVATHKTLLPQAPPIQPISRNQNLPLSLGQEQLWFLCQLAPDTPFYNEPITIHLPGSVNAAILERSIDEIIKRHEILRTTFAWVDGEPMMVIRDAATFTLPLVNLAEFPETERESEALRIATLEARLPFDLVQGPLLRATLIQLSATDCRLFITLHHIITDAVSLYSVFLKEIATFYTAFSLGLPAPLPEVSIQYADFAYWQRQSLQGEFLANQLDYWKQQLANLPTLQLPTDRSRSPVQSFRGARQCLTLPLSLTEMLKDLSRKEGVTLFVTLMAAFQTLLSRYTGQTDVPVGTAVNIRNRQELERTMGYLLNSLVIRSDLSGNPSFKELLARVREVILGAYAHQELPFQKLVEELQPERNLSYNPLFQVAFVLEPPLVQIDGWRISQLDVDTGTAKSDLYLELDERPSGIIGRIEYNTDLFDAATITRMVGHFQTLLEGIVANPEQKISQLPLLTEFERQQLAAWNNTQTDYPKDACIHQLFEEQVERSRNAIALVFEDKQLTYQELNQRANQLAHHLRNLGVEPEVLVGICVERSLEMVVGILGILKAGGAYVPLDPAYPPERLTFMLEDASVPVLLTQAKLVESLPKHQGRVVCIDTDWEVIQRQSEENPEYSLKPDNLAYVIYTSGSTGKPKGVLVAHSGLSNLATAQIQIFNVQPNSRVLQFASLSFDASVSEIFMALVGGATLVIGTRESLLPGADLIQLLRDYAIATVTLPPSVLALLLPEELPTLQTIIVAGEACSPDLAAKWSLGRRFFNAYGPTESTVCATIAEYTDRHKSLLPIGRPIANTQVYILDAQLQPVPIGIPGELYIGGAGLARGYLNRPDLTEQKFIPNPFSNEPNSRLYKTGDLVRYLSDGNIEFLGRIDHQVKIRGFRIELGEIEAVLSQHPDVRESVVIKREDESGNQRLVAYIVSHFRPERVPYQIPCLAEFDGHPAVKLRTEDISIGGVCLVDVPDTCVLGQSVRLCLHLPGFNDELWLEGTVAWCRRNQAGIELVLNAREQNILQKSIESLLETQGFWKVLQRTAVGSLRNVLKEKLPNYMMPSSFVFLNALPLSPNGKIDRKALPEPDTINPQLDYVPPQNESENAIAIDWEQVLHPEKVAVDDSLSDVELGDIEALLSQHPDVRESVVMKREDASGNQRLVAYIVSKLTPERTPFKSECWAELDGNSPVKLRTEDISIGGVGLVDVPDTCQPGQSVRLCLRMPSSGEERWLEGRVAWRRENQAGIELALNGSEQDLVQQSIAYLLETQGFWKVLQRTAVGSLRNLLQQKLPNYMIPSSFVFLNALPLISNGKVDPIALPVPDPLNIELETTYVAPQTEIEKAIAIVWQQVLHLEKVGVDDNFFDLGGHSLLMAQAHSKLKEVVNKDVSMIELFKYPTISSLAKHLSQNVTEKDSSANSLESSANKQKENRIQKQKAALNRQKEKRQIQGKD
ncbi:non-ribosomal peptide synthetase [Argonema antarcticum]|uniref:non-ribosomal peptide synthetase n=1 Tax=Argonema antarcticum TaxID=2942763 RepID=UPI002011753F|nr:non-ribosomal peptide synthetase [Argonema antarcticum]MCL1472480.1 amino acid adenylation domain-containing protein [Argonema antarcticum A004/B2]